MVAIQEVGNEAYRDKIRDYLRELNRVQGDLYELQQDKRTALIARNLEVADEVQRQEQLLHQQLQTLLEKRRELLRQMQSAGFSGQTLNDVCRNTGWDAEPETKRLFSQSRHLSESLRQTSWGTWVFTHRASQYYNSILEIIARGGKKNSIYHDGSSMQQEPSGGSLLDASI